MVFQKIIHQIWLQGENNIPVKFRDNITKTKNLHKKWNYILWDDLKIIKLLRTNDKLLNTYYKLEYLHQKVDFARYVILYIYGGIYIDIDAYAIKSLDKLVDLHKKYKLIVSKLRINNFEKLILGSEINNGIIIAHKKSIVLLDLIKSIIETPHCKFYQNKIMCINSVTGPNRFSRIINKYVKYENEVLILDNDYFEPCNLDICKETKNTYIVHIHEGSWYSSTLKNVFELYLKNKIIVYSIIMIVIMVFMMNTYNRMRYQIQ